MSRGRKTLKKCKYCNNEFEVLLIKLRVGKGLFCSVECYNKHRAENKQDEKYLNKLYQKKHKYGLSKEEYFLLFEKQNNTCAICGIEFDENINKQKACVDHSHENGDVRGLLCDKCNRGIGAFDDNIEKLENAIIYLKKYL